MNPSLTEFLLARIAEDEAAASAATASPWVSRRGPREHVYAELGGTWVADVATREDRRHIARHDPARVLAECEAKRQIVTLISSPGIQALRLLASVYADHPDYLPKWTPWWTL